MTSSWILDNLLAWSAQVFILVGAAAAASLALRHPRARLLFWQAILAAMLLLPLFEPWTQSLAYSSNGVSISMQPVAFSHAASQPLFTWQREYLLYLIAAGALLRALWIAIGFTRLRRHRLAATTLADPPVPFEREHVRWYISDTVSGPVTFGWIRPSILLPSRVNQLSADLREAIACHELVHVERGDWLFVLAEEAIRTVLWFHPAVWFVLGRIQLSREQTVDREVVGLTQNRDGYLDALVAVAQHKLQPDVAPAPLFLKKRQLAERVAAVLKETRMSKPRLVLSFTTVLSAALVAARFGIWFFPLQAPAQSINSSISVPMDPPGITVDAGAPLMHRSPVRRPSTSVSGTVVIEASLNSKGEVSDARIVSGPEELRRAALESVLDWHYSTVSALPPTVQITIKFDPPAGNPSSVQIVGNGPRHTSLALPPATLGQLVFANTPPEVEQRVRQKLTVHEGDLLTPEALLQMARTAQEVDEHFYVNPMLLNSPDGRRQATVRFALGSRFVSAPPAPPPPPPAGVTPPAAPDAPAPPQRIRVGGNVAQNNLMVKVTPAYPPVAKQARIQGVVVLNATINKDGTIQSLDVVSGHPLLVDAATDAVKQWVYRPTLLNGNPVEVTTQIDVNFTLSQ